MKGKVDSTLTTCSSFAIFYLQEEAKVNQMKINEPLRKDHKTTRELLIRFSKIHDLTTDYQDEIETIKEEVARRNIGLVKSIAGDFSTSPDLFEDLAQVGFIGLMNAIYNFDPTREVNFSTYATHLIKGEIRHYIRDNYSMIRIPRYLQELSRELKQAEESFFLSYGRYPKAVELADMLNVEREGVVQAYKTSKGINYISLDWKPSNEWDNQRAKIDITRFKSANSQFPFEYKIRLEVAIEGLSDPQRKVLEGIFYEGRTQKEVGEKIGYSQRHVSRLKDQALDRLRRIFRGSKR